MSQPDVGTARTAVLELLAQRAPTSSICPSDAARACEAEDWRRWMDTVREAAASLADQGAVRVTQGERTVDVRTARGAIRLRRGPSFEDWSPSA